MFKRIFWLAVVVAAGWLIWLRLRQRQDQFAAYTPQFAPHQPFVASTAPAAPQPPVSTQPSDPAASADSAIATLDPTPAAPAVSDVQPEPSPATPSEAEGEAESEPADAQPEQSLATPSETEGEAESEPAEELGEVIGYCVRCKTKRTISDAHEETTESGRRAARGICSVCGANMFTFLATNDDDEPADDQQA